MNDINCWESKFETCFYSDRLLDKILNLNNTLQDKIDITEIKKAIYYAKKYHGKQKRQSGEPYYSHPLKVAEMVSNYKTTILVTSILHDTLEDTELTKEMINHIFSPIIAKNVEYLTRVKADQKISAAKIIEYLWINKQTDLLLIKLLDRIHNLQTIKVKSRENINKILEETMQKFISLSMYLKSVIPKINLENKITNLCYKNLLIKKIKLSELEMNLNDDFKLPLPETWN